MLEICSDAHAARARVRLSRLPTRKATWLRRDSPDTRDDEITCRAGSIPLHLGSEGLPFLARRLLLAPDPVLLRSIDDGRRERIRAAVAEIRSAL